jgi:hypothetical protein
MKALRHRVLGVPAWGGVAGGAGAVGVAGAVAVQRVRARRRAAAVRKRAAPGGLPLWLAALAFSGVRVAIDAEYRQQLAEFVERRRDREGAHGAG